MMSESSFRQGGGRLKKFLVGRTGSLGGNFKDFSIREGK